MQPQAPLVSVVTPTFNAGRYLKNAIESVLAQDYPNIEYLIVDSHSTDDTHDILRSYDGRLRIIDAPRDGPASAIHAGFSQARGEILAWLNADDTYEPEAVSSAVACFLEDPAADVVYGDAWWIDGSGAVIRPYPTVVFDAGALSRDCFISQPAAFFRDVAYRACSLDQTLPLSFDYDLWIRLASSHMHFKYLPKKLARSRMHLECLTLARRRQVFEISMKLLKRHYGYVPLPWILAYLSHRLDGRDQFFEPLQRSASVFAASLPVGIALNPNQTLRVVREWVSAGNLGLRRAFARFVDGWFYRRRKAIM